MLVLHHAIIDGWSLRLLLDELAALYEAQLSSSAVQLAPLALQYSDYAFWQTQQDGGDLWEGQLAYWQKQLHGSPDLLDLPSLKVRPKVASGKGFKVPVFISAATYKQLQALASSLQATPVMVALAAFQVSLTCLLCLLIDSAFRGCPVACVLLKNSSCSSWMHNNRSHELSLHESNECLLQIAIICFVA